MNPEKPRNFEMHKGIITPWETTDEFSKVGDENFYTKGLVWDFKNKIEFMKYMDSLDYKFLTQIDYKNNKFSWWVLK